MFSKEQLKVMRNEIQSALADVANKYNCEVQIGNVKYSEVTANFSIDFNTKGSGNISAEQNLFNTYCARFGFIDRDYMRAVVIDGKTFHLFGFNLKARKNYCLIRNEENKTYTCEPECILNRWRV